MTWGMDWYGGPHYTGKCPVCNTPNYDRFDYLCDYCNDEQLSQEDEEPAPYNTYSEPIFDQLINDFANGNYRIKHGRR